MLFLVVLLALGLVFVDGTANADAPDAPAAPGATASSAAPHDDARALFAEGQAAYQRGDYDEAASLWERAYAADARPALQYNLAQAYGRMGRLEAELAALERFISSSHADESLIEVASDRVLSLRERLARTALRLHGGVPGARLLVDGEEHAYTEGPLPVAPGSHELELRAEGYEPLFQTVLVTAGDVVDVHLTPELLAPSVRAPTPKSAIALWSSGGAVFLGGAVLGVVALTKSADARPGTRAAERAQGLALGADIGLAVGAAAAAVGLVLHLVRGDVEDTGQVSLELAPSFRPGGVTLDLGGRF